MSRAHLTAPAAVVPLRRFDGWLHVLGGVFGAVVAAGLLSKAWLSLRDGTVGHGLALTIVAYLFAGAAWRYVSSVWWRTAEVRIDESRLVVAYPGVLRRHLDVPRGGVRAVAVEDRSPDLPFAADAKRFPIGGSEAFLYSRRGQSRLPLLTYPSVVPNVAVILDDPAELHWRNPWKRPRRARGFLLATDEPEAMVAALHGWGVVQELTWDDYSVAVYGTLRPDPVAVMDSLRRKGRIAYAGAALVVVGLAVQLWIWLSG